MFVWIQINWKMVNTIWFRFDLIVFRKYFSVCTTVLHNDTFEEFWVRNQIRERIIMFFIFLGKLYFLAMTSIWILIYFLKNEIFYRKCYGYKTNGKLKINNHSYFMQEISFRIDYCKDIFYKQLFSFLSKHK